MGLPRTVSEINGDFSRKSFSHSYFAPLLRGFALELSNAVWSQKPEWWGYEMVKKVSLAV